jgi:IS30 family transposase
MRRYAQLTQEQRYHIYAHKKTGHFTQSEIAAMLGVHKSTISRELSRNRGGRGYRPKQAHELALMKRRAHARPRISAETWELVEDLVRLDLSPEQVSGRLKLERGLSISHERIYQHIYANKRAGGDLHKHLRCQKKRRKRYGKYSRRGQIPDRVGIELRPAIVDSRRRIGDWEADTIIGKAHRQAIVSLTERKSMFTLLRKVPQRTAELVEDATVKLLGPVKRAVHTITSDNGTEFAAHKAIAAALKAAFYFAHPYHAWERGTNENTNGLVRQYFPKGHDFKTITDEQISFVMERLNNRPRKKLGFRTPKEVFYNLKPVALAT